MSKYKSVKVKTPDGEVFDSKKELNRYMDLKLLEKAGKISDLTRQVVFQLIPSQKDIQTGKVIERPVIYKADFMYTRDGKTIVEDAKGVKTKDYIIKRKLMLFVHGIRITEV